TLLDGDPLNNFLKRDVTFNPDGILCGANAITIVGTYAYICCDAGLVVVALDDPAKPEVKCVIGEPRLKHPHAVQCQFRYAYLADGKNGMRVVQLTNPDTPGNGGFSPRPNPQLIATYKVPHGGHALAISKGLDRDRAVDESGNQLSVFGRVGARPFDLKEQQR